MVETTVTAVVDALAAARPDRLAVVDGDRRERWASLAERSRRFGAWLHGRGLGVREERTALDPWRSGQDHVGLCLHNGRTYLEGLLGAFRARTAPFNLNYRYGVAELRYLLADADARAVVFHSAYAPAVVEAAASLPRLTTLVQVPDCSGVPLAPGAIWYDHALAAGDPAGPPVAPDPDDLYILYTGGTTGRPKGVLWRQADALVACFGIPRTAHDLDEVVAAAAPSVRLLPTPPFIHGAGQWVALRTLFGGGTVVVPARPDRFDAAAIWRCVESERVSSLAVVGDAFCRPLLAELSRRRYDTSSLTVVLSGGAALTPHVTAALLEQLPTVMVVDGLGSSEVGGQVVRVTTRGAPPSEFQPNLVTTVLSADRSRILEPGEDDLGWLASAGRLALGYLDDPDRTSEVFPVVDGVRFGLPGDRARRRVDGSVEVLGRDSMTINSGGEKIFAEEVEEVLARHPAVDDVVVVPRPSLRWGEEAVAVIRVRAGAVLDVDELLARAEERLARFKLPKAVLVVDEVRRSPAGKADYRWARSLAASSGGAEGVERVEVERMLQMP
jgi:acyl-CoA synthetase (AMP-forming)/AMP-acid ligase II